jgi:hypothetical protein
MGILEEIRKDSNNKFSTNWFMKDDCWYCFDDGILYTQDKEIKGPESIKEITDKEKYDEVLNYKQGKK